MAIHVNRKPKTSGGKMKKILTLLYGESAKDIRKILFLTPFC